MHQSLRRESLCFEETTPNNKANIGPAAPDLEVAWLPSLPLTKKHKAPPISGLGILYSEELEKVLQVFETANLKESVKKFSRDQAAALNIDPTCRLHWLETSNSEVRARARADLLTQAQ